MNKSAVAANIRQLLERRIAKLIGCEERHLRCLKLGGLVHFLFLLDGPSEMIGGFNTSMHAMLDLLGPDIVWADPKKDDGSETTPQIH